MRARQIYETAIRVVPHKQFTFAKLWISFARFEVRQLQLAAARKILGTAIGMCPKEALFKGYIQLEFDLREFDRVRTLYEKYIEVRIPLPRRIPSPHSPVLSSLVRPDELSCLDQIRRARDAARRPSARACDLRARDLADGAVDARAALEGVRRF